MKTCYNCACDRVCNHTLNGYETCGNWIQKPLDPPTNADRIRAMSDEELAQFAIMSSKFFCTRKMPAPCEKPMSCTECVLAWLTQPAEEER